MLKNDESNSLIDWNGPVVECTNIPLIPLPLFNNQIQLSEDNPFDAIERQINENEPFFDVLNSNSHFCNDRVDSCIIKNQNMENSVTETNDFNPSCKNHYNFTFTEKINSQSERPEYNNSVDSILSNISDIKEMVMNRISNCINRTLHQSQELDSFLKRTTSQFSTSDFESQNSMNNCFILSNEEKNSEFANCMDAEFMKNFGDEIEDIQAITPKWDEILSSSDEEIEKPIVRYQVSLISNSKQKLSTNQVEKKKEVPASSVLQDFNIGNKKSKIAAKQGALIKTAVSLTRKMEHQKAAVTTNDNKMISLKNLTITPTLEQSKFKKRSFPMATSTPQSLKRGSNTRIQKLLSQKCTPKGHTRSSSPDSTSGSRCSKFNANYKSPTKTGFKKLGSTVVSSSTNITFPRITSRGLKELRNHSVTEIVHKTPIRTKSN